ncbi:fatty acid hydroxylase superfamily protein [Sarocladium implicatum]|nr:fatty acid hydroxylase superfamily protein [Sarocladium implicatum]
MDVLLSLPIASFFLAPSITSWSTSLNLLFFYMTWTTLVLSHNPLHVHLVGITAVRIVFWLIPSLFFLLFDTLLPSLAESLKLGGRSALPPRDPKVLGRTLILALLNLALVIAVEGGLSIAFTYIFGHPQLRTTSTLPLPWQIIKHVLLLVTSREILTYYIHRFTLHDGGKSAAGSSFISGLHLRYAHARAGAPFSLQLFADHPLPLILHRLVPIYLPAALLRPHLLTYFLFFVLSTLEETFAMSGYKAVPGIFMGGIVQRSAIHYATRGASNYGAWGLLDWINGTSRGRDVLEDVKDEADKHNLAERSSKKAGEGMNLIQDSMEAWRDGNGTRRSSRKKTPKKAE